MYLEARGKPSKWIYKGRETPITDIKPWIPNDIPCAHLRCPECGGSGIKANGSTCVHMISCRCGRCSPVSM